MLPKHDKIKCSECFNGEVIWGNSVFEENGWRLENNPCAWGSQNPIVLILGFSKGTNQTNKLPSTPFDDVPFKGMRNFLSKILQKLRLMSDFDDVDNKINSGEQDFAFGSLIRCSISKYSDVKGKYLKSGDIINSSATDPNAQRIISNCMNKFLTGLPDRLKLIIMLSNDDGYVDACYNSFRTVYPNLHRINPVAYTNDVVTWVHTIHPSGAAGKHRIDWLNSTKGKQATKREYALEAVNNSGVIELLKK